MPNIKTYDPSQVSIIASGSILESWGTVAIAFDEDKFSFESDTSSGEATRVKNKSKLGTITITMPQASGDNDTMSALEVTDSLGAYSVIDNGGSTLAIIPLGTIMKMADAEFAKENSTREWVVKGNLDVYVVGGNT